MKEILFQLDSTLPASLQSQLREQVVTGILNRALQPGERLPSSRALSRHLGVSRNTVMLAYQALADDGYLLPVPRSGFVVSPDAPAHPQILNVVGESQQENPGRFDWANRLSRSSVPADQVAKPLNWREYRYPFIYGQADFSLFSHSEWRECARQALGARDFGSLAGDFGINDDPLLVDYIASHSLPQRGVFTDRNSILVTLGAQNALFLALTLLAGKGLTVGIEQPGYPDIRNIAGHLGSKLLPLNVNDEGLELDEELLAACDVICITPSHQCPTTVTMPLEKRQRLLELAEIHDFVIIEDDYEYEMNFLASPSPALKTMDQTGRVIYVGSFSKSLFPGLRLGYLVADPVLIGEARQLRHLMLRHPPGHVQRTAAYFMALGHHSSQMRKYKRKFSERREKMATALEFHGLNRSNAAVFGGTSFWIEGPEGLDTRTLSDRLEPQSVLIESGHSFFVEPKQHANYFRVAYSSIASDRIDDGVRIIAETINDILADQTLISA